MDPKAPVDGPLVWDFVYAFFAARRAFHAVFRRYETRVQRFAREAGVHRDDLVLRPGDLARLFYPRRLQHLRDQRLVPLRTNGDFDLTGWLAILLLFVLAQVFREGTRRREDLKGTV